MNIAVLITTHQRPKMLKTLLSQIYEQCLGFCTVQIIIAVDGSQPGYEGVVNYLEKKFPENYFLVIPPLHGGKQKYWELVTML